MPYVIAFCVCLVIIVAGLVVGFADVITHRRPK